MAAAASGHLLAPLDLELKVASSQMTVSGLWEQSSMSVDWLVRRLILATRDIDHASERSALVLWLQITSGLL